MQRVPTVLLTADLAYGGARSVPRGHRSGERDLLDQNRVWAGQLDASDGIVDGGEFRQVVIAAPTVQRGRRTVTVVDDADRVRQATLAGYERAARQAGRGGILGVMVGHGSGGITSSDDHVEPFADLGPGRSLRVRATDIQRWGERVVNHMELTTDQQALEHIGAYLRDNGVRRVDLLTCSLGLDNGTLVLNGLHRRWRVPVRGLRGYLEGEWTGRAGASDVEMALMDQQGHRGRAYTDRIPPDTLWVTSRPPRD